MTPEGRAKIAATSKALWASGRFDHVDFNRAESGRKVKAAWAGGKFKHVRWPGWTNKHKRIAPAWNKGLSNADPRVAALSRKVSATMRKQFNAGLRKMPTMSAAARERLSVRQTQRNSGGRSKWFDVGGVKVQGTWERDFALALNSEGIRWSRPRDPWRYIVGDRAARYTPDFYLPTVDLFVEVKGFWWGNDVEKMRAVRRSWNKRRLVILDAPAYRRVMSAQSLGAALYGNNILG